MTDHHKDRDGRIGRLPAETRIALARARLHGPRAALAAANLVLLVVWPIAWMAPLATAGFMPYFGGDEVSVISGVQVLWQNDRALAILVAVFAMVMPILKTLVLALIHARLLTRRALALSDILGKLSMVDVFLVAFFIVITKGVGIGYVETGWGLWLFTGAVLGQIVIGLLSRRLED